MTECNNFSDKSDEMKELLALYKENKENITTESVEKLRCLLCQNSFDNINGDFIALFKQLTENNPYEHLLWYGFGCVCEMSMQNEISEQCFRQAHMYNPMNVTYCERLCFVLIQNYKLDEVGVFLERAKILKTQKLEKIIFETGCAYFRLKDYDKTRSALLDCRSINTVKYWETLGDCYDILNIWADAIECYYKCIAIENRREIISKIAICLFKKGDYSKALILFLEINENQIEDMSNIGACYSNIGELESAVKIYDDILLKEPKDTLVLFNKAKTLTKQNKDYSEIVDLCRKILDINPSDVNALEYLADVYFKNKQYSHAAAAYIDILALYPKRHDIWRELCKSQMSLYNPIQALHSVNQAISLSEASASDFFRVAICYEWQNEFDLSVKYYKKSLDLDPYNAIYIEGYASLLSRINNYTKSIEMYELALEIDSNNYIYWWKFGDLLIKAKKYSVAVEAFNKAYTIKNKAEGKEDAVLTNELGWAYFSNADYENALKYFYKAIKLNSDTPKYKTNFMLSYYRLGRMEELFNIIETDKDSVFQDNSSKIVLAQFYKKRGNNGKAINVIDDLISNETNPLIKDYYINTKGLILYFSNDFAGAIELLSQNISNPLLLEDSARCLGICYLSIHDAKKAITSFVNACDCNKDNAYNWNNLALAYLRDDQNDEAISCFEKAMVCENAKQCAVTFYLFEKIKMLTKNDKREAIIAFYNMLDYIWEIKNCLKYNIKSNVVYHYAKLPTLNDLLKDEARFRMYNSVYMNDPLEGKAFLKLFNCASSIQNRTGKSSRNVLNHSNVFLASFSQRADFLSMWVQYANNAQGCSLGFGDDFFDETDNEFVHIFGKLTALNNEKGLKENETSMQSERVEYILNCIKSAKNNFDVNLSNEPSENHFAYSDNIKMMDELLKSFADETIINDETFNTYIDFSQDIISGAIDESIEKYCLYRVCYLEELDDKTITSSNIDETIFKTVKTHIANIELIFEKVYANSELSSIAKDVIGVLLNESLDHIRYLFKSKDYEAEDEVRLIKSELLFATNKKIKEQASDNVLPKVYIDVEKPVQIKEVILGAKVVNPYEAAPNLIRSGKIDKVTLSSIQYQ